MRWINSWTEVEDLGQGKLGATVHIGHRVFKDLFDNKWKKHKLLNLRSEGEGIILQSAKCAIQLFGYYAKFYDPILENVRIGEERWAVEAYDPRDDTWKVCLKPSSNLLPSNIEIEEGSDFVRVKGIFENENGIFELEYYIRDGRGLKYNIRFTSKIQKETQFRIIQRWNRIKCKYFRDEIEEKEITGLVKLNPRKFIHLFEAGKKPKLLANFLTFWYRDHQTGELKTDLLKTIVLDIETEINESKLYFVYGNWTLNTNETLILGSTVIKSPISCDEGWANCTNAHTEDANYAETLTDATSCIWEFGFDPLHHLINSVKVKVQTYTGNAAKHSINLAVWNGSAWSSPHSITPTTLPCTEQIIDVTEDFTWTSEMIEQIKVRLTSDIGGGLSGKKWVRCCFIEIEINYTIGSIYIATLSNPTDDDTITYSTFYYFSGWNYLQIGASTGWLYRAYVEWDISSIPDSVFIQKVVFKYHGYTHNIDCKIREMLDYQPSSGPKTFENCEKIFNEIGEGTIYVDPSGFPEVGINKEIDLGSDALLDLQNQLTSDWFAIGIQSDNEGILQSSNIWAEEKIEADPSPTLYIEYNIQLPTGKMFLLDKENHLFRIGLTNEEKTSELTEEKCLNL